MTDEQNNQSQPETVEKEKYIRLAADFDNYKKDENRRIQELLKFGNEAVIAQVLDVVDSLEAALQHAPPDTDAKWLEGIGNVAKQFQGLFGKYGVERIKTVGEKFDPLYHEAVQVVESQGPPEQVTQEVRAGYTMHGKVIRPARVTINK